MSSKKATSSNGSRASSSAKSTSDKSVFVSLNEEKIREKAFLLSQQSLNWDQLVWSVAEDDVRLSLAIPKEQSPLQGKPVKDVKIDVTKVIAKPRVDDVRKMAEMVANHHPSLQELHWNLAIREYLWDSVKKAI